MSQKDILRRYLDILNEDDSSPSGSSTTGEMPTADKIQIAPPKGQGSINEVITAVKNFQEASGMEPTGRLDPKTLAELLSQSGRMGQEEMAKLQAGQEQQGSEVNESTGISENIEVGDRQQVLLHKAALHEGYSQGLRGHECMCPHSVGTGEHSYHLHGHGLGLKECGGIFTRAMPGAM
jgi:hypothetical protein